MDVPPATEEEVVKTDESVTSVTTSSVAMDDTVAVEETPMATLSSSPSSSRRTSIGNGSSMSFLTLNHKDAFLLFRALCKLSMKGLHEDSSNGSQNSDPIALQNK